MDKLLLEYPWLSKVVSLSKDNGLDWLLMVCLALELSGGDPRCRTLDSDFLLEHMGADCPLTARHWYNGVPDVELFDLATRWGLFQILGRVAVEKSIYSGRFINFIEAGSNTRAACMLMTSIINNGGTIDDGIRYFGADPSRVYRLMNESRESIEVMLHITEEATVD